MVSGTRARMVFARPGPVLQPERDVVLDALHHQLRTRVLEHDTDDGRDRAGGARTRVELPDGQLAVHARRDVARDEAREREAERALARAGRTDDEQARAGGHVERDAGQRRPARPLVGDPQPARVERRAGQAGNPSSTPVFRSER